MIASKFGIGQQVRCSVGLHRQLEFHLSRAVTVIEYGHEGFSIQHPGKGIALGGQLELLHLAPAQGRVFGLQPAQCGVHTGDGVGGQVIPEFVQLQAGAQGPVTAPLLFSLDAKFGAVVDGRNAPKRVY